MSHPLSHLLPAMRQVHADLEHSRMEFYSDAWQRKYRKALGDLIDDVEQGRDRPLNDKQASLMGEVRYVYLAPIREAFRQIGGVAWCLLNPYNPDNSMTLEEIAEGLSHW